MRDLLPFLAPFIGFVGIIWKLADIQRKEENELQTMQREIEENHSQVIIEQKDFELEVIARYETLAGRVDELRGAIDVLKRGDFDG